jgi:hypothetical protein
VFYTQTAQPQTQPTYEICTALSTFFVDIVHHPAAGIEHIDEGGVGHGAQQRWLQVCINPTLVLMQTFPPKPFHLLSHEQFARLSREEKVAYLSEAIEAVNQNVPMLGPVSDVVDLAGD